MNDNKIKLNLDNIKLPFAEDKYKGIRLITEIDETNRHEEYVCPICKTKVIPCAINYEEAHVTPYFKHDKVEKCNTESMIHFWYKEKYITSGDVFYINKGKEKKKYICKETITEQLYKTIHGDYYPDVTVITEDGEKIFFEYKYTNKKGAEKYSDIWRELECTVVEIDIKTLYDSGKDEKVFRPLFCDGIVMTKTKNEYDKFIRNYTKKNNIYDYERIKYLNGFLRDCCRYNHNKMPLDELILVIDNMNNMDKQIIPKLLKRLHCEQVVLKYSEYRYNKFLNKFNDYIKENNLSKTKYDVNLIKCYTTKFKYGIRFDNCIKIELPKECVAYKTHILYLGTEYYYVDIVSYNDNDCYKAFYNIVKQVNEEKYHDYNKFTQIEGVIVNNGAFLRHEKLGVGKITKIRKGYKGNKFIRMEFKDSVLNIYEPFNTLHSIK